MKKVIGLLFIALSVFFAFPAFAKQLRMPGSNTLVICQSEKPDELSSTDFLNLFPKLLSSLNAQRRAGTVVDAYFMQKLDEGVVFVVTSKAGDSEAKAKEIVSGFQEIHEGEGSNRRVSCKYIAIGPKLKGFIPKSKG